jgi:hypothetical protein
VAKLLRDHGYSLRRQTSPSEVPSIQTRNAQFEHIDAKAQDCVDRGVPVISVDTKKKEVGNFKNGGRDTSDSIVGAIPPAIRSQRRNREN